MQPPHLPPQHAGSADTPAAAPSSSAGLDGRAGLDWVMRYAVPLVGVVGAGLYGVLRLAYVFFYLRLRTKPEEVGYGYSRVLAEQLIGAIELVVLVTVAFFVVGAPVGMLMRRVRRGRQDPSGAEPPSLTDKALVLRLALRCAAFAVVVVLVGLPVLGWLEGAEAVKGYTVRNVYLTNAIRLPVLAVEAVPATVDWTPGKGTGGENLSGRRCLLYLGHADGTSIFYDVSSEESLHLPSGDIVVILQNTTSVPLGC
jgi:hypothetical protein